ncbi:hypothetical protein BcepSauron_380 [Burkholderia phage BcepSauron]|uniref:Uncharacterized protein n=1 Tax=Burkholderia phage BcepSauron TaxID=2530033 RepID=A0A482MNQ7_9CAUD|nr:hypothetical protein H1O17_gp380 [Burkholderia phage BcepSauron]QBQ74760.1 hypothetical protein BcepSauron_380 [Burkholderia phage BcepSauron]
MKDAAVEAIKFAIGQGLDGLSFLNAWLHGDFDEIRRDWPEAPEDVYPVTESEPPETAYRLAYPISTSEIEGSPISQEITFNVTFGPDNKVSPETLLFEKEKAPIRLTEDGRPTDVSIRFSAPGETPVFDAQGKPTQVHVSFEQQ